MAEWLKQWIANPSCILQAWVRIPLFPGMNNTFRHSKIFYYGPDFVVSISTPYISMEKLI